MENISNIQTLLQEVSNKLNCWGAVLMYKDGDKMRCKTSIGIPKIWEQIVNEVDHSMNGTVVTTKKFILDNTPGEFKHPISPISHMVTATLIIPVFKDNDCVGTLELLHDREGVIFSKEDIEKIEYITKQFGNYL